MEAFQDGRHFLICKERDSNWIKLIYKEKVGIKQLLAISIYLEDKFETIYMAVTSWFRT